MAIGSNEVRNVLAKANDAIINELRNIAVQRAPAAMNNAAQLAAAVGSIKIATGGTEAEAIAFIIDTFRAVLYKGVTDVTQQFYQDQRHTNLVQMYQQVVAYIQGNQHLLTNQGGGLGSGGGAQLGSGVPVTLPATTPSAGGVAVDGAGVVIGALPGSTPTPPPATPDVALGLPATAPAATPAPVVVAPVVVTPPKPAGFSAMNFEQLTGDQTMETYQEHNLLVDSTVAVQPKTLNRSVSKFRENGNFAEGLVAALNATGIHRYEGTDIIVTLEDRKREYFMDNPALSWIGDLTKELATVYDSALKSARENADVENAFEELSRALTSTNEYRERIIKKCKEMLTATPRVVTVTELSIIQTFLRKFRELVDLRMGRVVHIMTNAGQSTPGMTKRIRWDGGVSDLIYIMEKIYSSAAGGNGMVEDGESFHNLYIAALQQLRTIDLDWSDTGLTIHNVVVSIWLPAHYSSINNNSAVSNLSLGNTQEAVQTIHDELMANMPIATVAMVTPEVSKVLIGAGDGSVISYNAQP